jgi:hypothetical protein
MERPHYSHERPALRAQTPHLSCHNERREVECQQGVSALWRVNLGGFAAAPLCAPRSWHAAPARKGDQLSAEATQRLGTHHEMLFIGKQHATRVLHEDSLDGGAVLYVARVCAGMRRQRPRSFPAQQPPLRMRDVTYLSATRSFSSLMRAMSASNW